MEVLINPSRTLWAEITARPRTNDPVTSGTVQQILADVWHRRDAAVKDFSLQYDGVRPEQMQVTDEEIRKATAAVPDDLKNAIGTATANIERFHAAQVSAPLEMETMPGVKCWRKSVPINRVGLYIPGGSAPLISTVLMLAIPARLAGCPEIIMCTPPDKSGNLHPAICYAAAKQGINKLYRVGGAQAIAAMAYGTDTIPKCDKIFGPGNRFVTIAKQLVNSQGTAIDMPAGPTELLVIADQTCNPDFVAADLLAQAEHGPDSQVFVVTCNKDVAQSIVKSVGRQAVSLPRTDLVQQALGNGAAIVFGELSTAIDFANEYAPEHLIIQTENALQDAERITNAGSVFIGEYSPEAAGDYASGPNHTLPTSGYARAFAGVSTESFQKNITFQHLTRTGLESIAPVIELLATAEGLEAHRRSVGIRLKK